MKENTEPFKHIHEETTEPFERQRGVAYEEDVDELKFYNRSVKRYCKKHKCSIDDAIEALLKTKGRKYVHDR